MARKVTVVPNNWTRTMPLLIHFLKTSACAPGHKFAVEELMRLARATDENNNDIEKHGYNDIEKGENDE